MTNLSNLIEIIPSVGEKIINETLSRMGIANKKERILYPTCYLYNDFGKFYIVHFKELFLLTRDDGYNNLSVDDTERKNAIIFCLLQWGLVDLATEDDVELLEPHDKFIYVLPFKEKQEWVISHKFNTANMGINA